MIFGSDLFAVFSGLASAACWGAGDFSGGVATKHSNVYTVVIVSQFVGVIFLIAVALLILEPFSAPADMLLGAAAGISGVIGLVALYRGLAVGRMGIVAPVAAVVTAVVPVVFGFFREGLPAPQQLAGFVIALCAVWFISRSGNNERPQVVELGLPLVAGLGFGLFFILIDRMSTGAVVWPLVAARLASIGLLLLFVSLRRQREVLTIRRLPVIALAGILDAGGNAFFTLAAQAGRLDIAAVLASLYPAATICLAWFILREKLVPQQWGGVAAALFAVVLIAS